MASASMVWFRWAVAHFGQKLAGSQPNVIVLATLHYLQRAEPLQGSARGASDSTTHGCSWVDDITLIVQVPPHSARLGLACACPVYMAHLPRAQSAQRQWHDPCSQIGLGFSVSKHQQPTQRICYMGAILDTVQGRDQHYSDCTRHTRVYPASSSRALGTEEQPSYDTRVTVTSDLSAFAARPAATTRCYAPRGSPLLPLVPSSPRAAFRLGDLVDPQVDELVWDASPVGWAALFRRRPLDSQLLVAGMWPPGHSDISPASSGGVWGRLRIADRGGRGGH